jgi:tRNA A-37 threonylcarbamoyl transferase component Bud32
VTKFGDRYELVRRVGSGGMAEVWLAHDEELAGRPVAIKIMHKHMLPNEDDVARFEREMRFAALMAHPNIVTVYTTGTCDGAPFLVMEYLRGHDLEKAPPVGDAEGIAGIGRDICSGLAYAHAEGVIHRDIKPANLFRCENGRVKITDFGVAKAVSETALSTAVLVGTFAYMPPERWRGDPSAVSGDIWAAGCVLYRLISGRAPRLLPDVGHYAAAATRGEPVPDLGDITNAPGWLAGPVMAMLEDNPARRPTAEECVEAFSGAFSSASFSGASFSVPSSRLPTGGRRRRGRGRRVKPVTGPVVSAASEDPVTAPVARSAAAPAVAGRSRRLNRGVTAVGGLALLLAGSLTAWRLGISPQAAGPAAGHGTSPAANHAAAAIPPASASAPGPGSSTAPDPAAIAAPSSTRPGSTAGGASAPAAGSRSAGPSGSSLPSAAGSPVSASAGTVASSPPDSTAPSSTPASSTPASTTPTLVPVPNVIGMNFPQAQRELQSDGFTVAGVRNQKGNKVVAESPTGEAPEGSVITVTYGT